MVHQLGKCLLGYPELLGNRFHRCALLGVNMCGECKRIYRFEDFRFASPHLQKTRAEFCHRYRLSALNVGSRLRQRISINLDIDAAAMLTDTLRFLATLAAVNNGSVQCGVVS